MGLLDQLANGTPQFTYSPAPTSSLDGLADLFSRATGLAGTKFDLFFGGTPFGSPRSGPDFSSGYAGGSVAPLTVTGTAPPRPFYSPLLQSGPGDIFAGSWMSYFQPPTPGKDPSQRSQSLTSGQANGQANWQAGHGLSGVEQWLPQLQEVSQRLGVPWQVLASVMGIESGGDASASSPQGAEGLMQVLGQYHAGRAEKYGADFSTPLGNIYAGADYLKELYDQELQAGASPDEAWAYAAGGYLTGDPNWWRNGNSTTDAFGSSGASYAEKFRQNLAALGWGAQRDTGNADFGPTSGGSGTGSYALRAVIDGPYTETQGYGVTDYSSSSGLYKNDFHDGRDYGIPTGTPLRSPDSGTVVYAGYDGGYGNTVMLRMADGYTVQYSHMDSLGASVGQQVGAGQTVGLSGNSGTSTGPHVHIRVTDPQGNSVDPASYFSG